MSHHIDYRQTQTGMRTIGISQPCLLSRPKDAAACLSKLWKGKASHRDGLSGGSHGCPHDAGSRVEAGATAVHHQVGEAIGALQGEQKTSTGEKREAHN